jgi:hypothetical protein
MCDVGFTLLLSTCCTELQRQVFLLSLDQFSARLGSRSSPCQREQRFVRTYWNIKFAHPNQTFSQRKIKISSNVVILTDVWVRGKRGDSPRRFRTKSSESPAHTPVFLPLRGCSFCILLPVLAQFSLPSFSPATVHLRVLSAQEGHPRVSLQLVAPRLGAETHGTPFRYPRRTQTVCYCGLRPAIDRCVFTCSSHKQFSLDSGILLKKRKL